MLQGYRGPSNLCNNGSGDSEALESSNGIQEIKFWWGARKDLNSLIPVIGTISFLSGRVVQTVQGQLDWSSLYFDSKTGECLSHNKEVAASKLNEIGRQLFDNGKFSEAKEYFSNAYTHSSNKVNYDVYKDNINKAKAEIDAISLNSQGDNLFNQGRYREAHSKYQEAYDKSQITKEKNKYAICKDKAKAELNAIGLKKLGDVEFNAGRYDSAKVKYQEAYDKSQITKEKNKYAICRDKAKLN
ncbi:MAG: tetratricopeptide repeat protein [Rickettsia endosymbiont of Ixodes persulcatus]|nr:tetratricopeptide repeat protein [Rickettsia endosymbiont of Ixodes persulcatus]MCZ6902472.1 tetratricopeptide repeat protein [Rickettsia endosymbiont of Ixodes persulcatus]MCZ6903171.1 tetratricopeptide repeat protein [Rickettsia endosymbiont of Ixodes persulcatus]MCZ6908960.1 tetratricopeptide repeat protein [Rickettsia endosymbiont of Ixodes persulcatus]MCZ6915004.1 tetratricopeptide repeat protein [Rickettsia endosymbiont of Ixodes persulcatus]